MYEYSCKWLYTNDEFFLNIRQNGESIGVT